MAKSKAAKRKRAAQANTSNKVLKGQGWIASPPDSTDSDPPATSLRTLIPDEELEITIDTLNSLADHPSLIKEKACRDLRTAVYGFNQACSTGIKAGGQFVPFCSPALAETRACIET